jgi:hypothetical protein
VLHSLCGRREARSALGAAEAVATAPRVMAEALPPQGAEEEGVVGEGEETCVDQMVEPQPHLVDVPPRIRPRRPSGSSFCSRR